MAIGPPLVTVDVLNDKQLVRNLEKLSDKFYKRSVRRATASGTKVLKREVRKRAPTSIKDKYNPARGQKNLRKSLGSKIVRFVKDGVWHGMVSPRKNFKSKIDGGGVSDQRPPFSIVHLLEFGHRIAPRIKGARLKRITPDRKETPPFATSLGFVRPFPFMVPGAKAARIPAVKAVKKTLKKEVVISNIELAKGMK